MVGGLILTDEKLDKIYGHKREFASISESMLYDIKKKYSPHKLLSKLRNVGIIYVKMNKLKQFGFSNTKKHFCGYQDF